MHKLTIGGLPGRACQVIHVCHAQLGKPGQARARLPGFALARGSGPAPIPSTQWAVDVSTDANPSYLAPAADRRERNSVTVDPKKDSSPDNPGSSEPRRTRALLPTRATVTCARNGRFSGVYQPPAARASDNAACTAPSRPPASNSSTASTPGRRGGSQMPRRTLSDAAGIPRTTPHAAATASTDASSTDPRKHRVTWRLSTATGRSPGTPATTSSRHIASRSRTSLGSSSAINSRARSPEAFTTARRPRRRPRRRPLRAAGPRRRP